ncbi:unnamed protein product [Allacma fusca]|uniref:C2H2-type domain-containing protein n=1 Tax=Allacma fusca TaxID=39272 RepID=A0A8J2J508_9HEXA|nr:unnamed protein product [Allacma fusca]
MQTHNFAHRTSTFRFQKLWRFKRLKVKAQVIMETMDEEILIPELVESPQCFVHCLFCCQNLFFKNYGLQSSESKLDLFCQAFNLTDVTYKTGLRMSDVCTSCLELIENIGSMMKSIQDIQVKLNFQKETIVNLLRNDDFTQSPEELGDSQTENFSSFQFRKDIQKKLNVFPKMSTDKPGEGVFPISVPVDDLDTDRELIHDYADDQRYESENTITIDQVKVERTLVEMDDPLKVDDSAEQQDNSKISSIKYNLPVGTVLRDCVVRLEMLKTTQHKYIPRRKAKNTVPCSFVDLKKDKCKYLFKDQESMMVHVRKIHLLKDTVCDVCETSFETKGKLMTHKVVVHGEPFPFVCPEEGCGKGFMSRNYLGQHMFSHTGGYPFSCNKCSRGFVLASKLAEHSKVHLEEDVKNFVCEICGKTYKYERNVRMHKQQHFGRPHKCTLCAWSFTTLNSLQNHQRSVHSDARPYLCQECGASFKKKYTLDRHVKNHGTVRAIRRRFVFRKRQMKSPPREFDPSLKAPVKIEAKKPEDVPQILGLESGLSPPKFDLENSMEETYE